MRLFQLFLLVIFGLFSQCSIVTQSADHPNLGETSWKLISINQNPVNFGEAASISFDEKESKVSGTAACNSFSSGYEMIKKAIKFESVITTKKYCEGKMDEENQIITNLQNVTRYDVKANKLYFYGKDQLLLTYKR